MSCCYAKRKKEVRFVVILGKEVATFSCPLEQWELSDMEGPEYRLLRRK